MIGRIAKIVACLLAAGGGYWAASALRGSGTYADDVLAAVRPASVTGVLDEASPLAPFHGTPVVDARRAARFAFWSQPTYSGAVDVESVPVLIAAHRAEALEPHLGEAARAELTTHLIEIDREIKETALLAYDEMERTKKALRETPEGTFIIRAADQRSDPLWARWEREMQRLEHGKRGIVIDEALQLRQPDYKGVKAHLYYVIDYTKWPVLRQMQDEYNRAVRKRIRAARDWIAEQYGIKGMSLFAVR